MRASPKDRFVIRGRHVGGHVRDAEVLGVDHEDGSPPCRVQSSETGHEAWFLPDADA